MHLRLASALSILGLLACGPRHSPSHQDSPDTNDSSFTSSETQGQTRGLSRTKVPPEQLQPAALEQPSPPATSTGLAHRYQEILNAHNQQRARHCATPLQWSQKLAAKAQGWANRLQQAGCSFEHSRDSPYGENMYFFAPAGSKAPREIAAGWYSEVALYDFAKGGFSMSTGHFTQIVWQGTSALGCGVSTCNGGETWVCNYDPPGNVQGHYQRHVLPTSCQ